MNQILQVINFSLYGYSFQYISGIFLSAGLDLTDELKFKFNVGLSAWKVNINSDNPALFVNLNLFALFLIILIERLQKKIEEIQTKEQVSLIGYNDQELPLT